MCLETMDTTSKHFKTSGLRKTTKQGPKLRWGLLRVSTEDEAFKQCRASVMKATIRKYLHQQQRRTRLAKVSKILTDIYEKEKLDSVFLESPAAACVQRRHPGAMAPENTTQYLMSNVYEDMKTHTQPAELPYEASAQLYGECLSPSSVYTALDTGYESCLAFQQRDFEEVFDFTR